LKKISATNVADETGKQYHIGAGPGDFYENILLVGDPDRVDVVAKRFDKVHRRSQHREFVFASGIYKGLELTVLGTGIGHDNTEIALIEACQITKNPTFIRCGSCGSLRSEVGIGDLVISKASVRLDGTTKYFVHEGYPAYADPEVTLALAAACHQKETRFHMGLTASAPSFYGAQGRSVKGFSSRFPELPNEMASQGVTNFEMETSALFVLASLRGVRAGAVCTVFANRKADQFADEAARIQAVDRCVEVSLQAFVILDKMDRQKDKTKTPVWVPHEFTGD
jgi:uridine phosphorylase